MNRDTIARFEEKSIPEPNSGCHLWLAAVDKDGYGVFQLRKGKTTRAHRLAYELYKGVAPGRLKVCHSCDVTSCVNPDHLFLGTSDDNNKDMDKKGRSFYKGKALVNVDQAREIKGYRRDYTTNAYIVAKKYGVSESCVYHIWAGHTWKEV